jgi:formylglycine-generating enzyme required for sulfatase activity
MLFELLFASAADAPLLAAPPTVPVALVCPAGTRLVEGVHHDQVERVCTDLQSGHCHAFVPGLSAFEGPATRVVTCMDEYEWPNKPGAEPEVMMRFVDAEAACEGVGKRLCTEVEWELACEGPSATPWPYGHALDPEACNTSKPYRPVSERKLASDDARVREAETRRAWQGERSGARDRCVSRFGVRDLVGNVEEWVASSRPIWPWKSALKGGFWAKPWVGCRGTNENHGPTFRFYEVGFRCCVGPTRAR